MIRVSGVQPIGIRNYDCNLDEEYKFELEVGAAAELTGVTLVTENAGTIVCGPGSTACTPGLLKIYRLSDALEWVDLDTVAE
jgi:hypothetical protein